MGCYADDDWWDGSKGDEGHGSELFDTALDPNLQDYFESCHRALVFGLAWDDGYMPSVPIWIGIHIKSQPYYSAIKY